MSYVDVQLSRRTVDCRTCNLVSLHLLPFVRIFTVFCATLLRKILSQAEILNENIPRLLYTISIILWS